MPGTKRVIDISEFSSSNISELILNQRTFESGTGTRSIPYCEYPFRYRYPTKTGGVIESILLVQFGDFEVENGVQPPNPAFSNDSAPARSSMKFVLSGEDGKRVENFFNNLGDISSEVIFRDRAKLGAFGKRATDPKTFRAIMSQPITYRLDQHGNPDDAKPPVKYISLDEFNGTVRTKFLIPTGEGDNTMSVPATSLYNKSVVVTPTVWVKRLFVGNVATVQCYLDSVIIKEVIEQVVAPVQSKTISSFVKSNPDAVAKLSKIFNNKAATPSPSSDVNHEETSLPILNEDDDDGSSVKKYHPANDNDEETDEENVKVPEWATTATPPIPSFTKPQTPKDDEEVEKPQQSIAEIRRLRKLSTVPG